MALSASQLVTLKNDIIAKSGVGGPLQAALAANDYNAIADFYNASSNPAFIVWKTLVSVGEVGDKINGGELAGLTSLNVSRLQVVVQLSGNGINPALADRRQFFSDIFSGAGGAITRANLDALWRRTAKVIEKLFATGTGSTASPATLVFEGEINAGDVADAVRA